ncbi:MAG: hypothetical protein AAFV53_27490 [Myxococcota bacterium]
MPQTSTADISAALSLLYRRPLTTSINSVIVLPFLLPVVPAEGKALHFTAEFTGAANATASTEGVARSSADADAEAEVPGTLPWAQYDKVASVTGLAQAVAGSNFNPESVGSKGSDLLMGRVERQHRRIALGVANDLYGGNPAATPPEMAGAEVAIDSSGAFSSIDPVTYPEWAAVENEVSLASLSFATIRQQLITPIYDACGEAPEFITTTSEIFDRVKNLFGDNELNVEREVTLARGGGSNGLGERTVKLKAGMNCVFVDGIPIIRDRQCTTNRMYGWNTRYVSIHQLSPIASILQRGAQGVLEFFRRITGNPHLQLPREALEGMAARSPGLTPHIRVLGDRGDSTEAMVIVYGQVEYTRRNAFGKLRFV